MLSGSSKWLSGVLGFILLTWPLYIQAETIYYYDSKVGQSDFEETMEKNPLGPEENIKSILLHKTGSISIHLVQIRFQENPHIHKIHDLIVTLKKGRGILHIENQGIPMVVGDTAMIPRGAVHYFENTGDEIVAGLGIFVPPFDGMDSIPVEKGAP